MTWWAYPFPVTVLALAATKYAEQAKGRVADVLMLALVSLSVLMTFVMVIFTIFNSNSLLNHHDNDRDDHGDYDYHPGFIMEYSTNFSTQGMGHQQAKN